MDEKNPIFALIELVVIELTDSVLNVLVVCCVAFKRGVPDHKAGPYDKLGFQDISLNGKLLFNHNLYLIQY